MRNEHNRSVPRTRRTSSAPRRDDFADWRRLTRPVILDVLDRTRDLCWSRELIDPLLEALHVSDEFDDLGNDPGHHTLDCAAPLGPVKPLRFASTPSGLRA